MADRPRFSPPTRTKPERQAPAHPWILPTIVVVAVVVVVGGIAWASALGHFF